jgi:hypothetical protein
MFRGLSLLAATELGGTVSRNIRAMPYFAFGALIFLFGFGFLLDLAHTWLSLRAGPLAASGILAGVLLAAAGGLLVVGRRLHRSEGRGGQAVRRIEGTHRGDWPSGRCDRHPGRKGRNNRGFR